MTAVVEDRRVRTTKAALQQAMVELVVEQGYEAISIDAIAQPCRRHPGDVLRPLPQQGGPAHGGGRRLRRRRDRRARARTRRPIIRPDASRCSSSRPGSTATCSGIIVRGEGDGGPLRRFTERVEEVIAADLTVKLRAERWRTSPRPDAHHEAARRPGRRRGRRGSSSTTTAARQRRRRGRQRGQRARVGLGGGASARLSTPISTASRAPIPPEAERAGRLSARGGIWAVSAAASSRRGGRPGAAASGAGGVPPTPDHGGRACWA